MLLTKTFINLASCFSFLTINNDTNTGKEVFKVNCRFNETFFENIQYAEKVACSSIDDSVMINENKPILCWSYNNVYNCSYKKFERLVKCREDDDKCNSLFLRCTFYYKNFFSNFRKDMTNQDNNVNTQSKDNCFINFINKFTEKGISEINFEDNSQMILIEEIERSRIIPTEIMIGCIVISIFFTISFCVNSRRNIDSE